MPAPTFEEFAALGRAEQILRRPELGVRPGDISDMFISGAAAMGDRLVGWFAERVAATYLDGAEGDDLTLLAADHWGINRRLATQATATVTITRSGADATPQTFAIGSIVSTLNDSQGKSIEFVTTSAASWPASTNSSIVIGVRAVVAGVAGNLSGPGQITRIVSGTPAGGTYALSAATQPAGGSEDETDPDLRDRVRLYPATLRRGTLPSLEYGAKSVSSIAVAKAVAVPDTNGIVTVYVSDASGNSTGTLKTVSLTTVDDGSMTAKVAIELINWAAAGAIIYVVGGTVQTVNITMQLTVKLGVDVNSLITAVQGSVTARVGRLNIGDTLYLSDIISAAKAVDPDSIVNVTMITPIVNTAPSTPGSIIRAGVVTIS